MAQVTENCAIDASAKQIIRKINLWLGHKADSVSIVAEKHKVIMSRAPGNPNYVEIMYVINRGTYNPLVGSLNRTYEHIAMNENDKSLVMQTIEGRIDSLAEMCRASGLEAAAGSDSATGNYALLVAGKK